MTGDRIPAKVLATHTIANVSETLAQKLGLPQEYRSIGILTADSDDVTYCALDEATKAAAVEVVYGRSLYAGAANASTKLAGEVIGILAGPSPPATRPPLRSPRRSRPWRPGRVRFRRVAFRRKRDAPSGGERFPPDVHLRCAPLRALRGPPRLASIPQMSAKAASRLCKPKEGTIWTRTCNPFRRCGTCWDRPGRRSAPWNA